MEKQEFISSLRDVLIRRGFDRDAVEAEMIPVGSYFDENGMTDITISVDEMADEIADMLRERSIPAGDDIESALLAYGAGLSSHPTAEEAKPVQPENDGNKSSGEPEPEEKPERREPVRIEDEPEEDVFGTDADAENIEEFRPKEERDDVQKAGFLGKLILKWKAAVRKPEENDADFPDEEAAVSDDGKNRVLFWVLFAVALPFIVALSLLMVLIYVAFWVALALIMILFVAALIAFVFIGVLVALIGIIYGVIMMIKGVTPIGLFEIGLGITVGAAVLFIGILVYNFAIRLIPFAMKMLAKLLFFAFRRGKEGVGAIRRLMRTV